MIKTITNKFNTIHKKQYNRIKDYPNILNPILSWYIPVRDQNLIAHVYREYSEDNKSKCFYCNQKFTNNYLRDFHLVHYHCSQLSYMCYECYQDDYSDESEIFFETWVDLLSHKSCEHNEADSKLELYIR